MRNFPETCSGKLIPSAPVTCSPVSDFLNRTSPVPFVDALLNMTFSFGHLLRSCCFCFYFFCGTCLSPYCMDIVILKYFPDIVNIPPFIPPIIRQKTTPSAAFSLVCVAIGLSCEKHRHETYTFMMFVRLQVASCTCVVSRLPTPVCSPMLNCAALGRVCWSLRKWPGCACVHKFVHCQ